MRKNIELSDEAVKSLSIQAIESGTKIKNYSHKSSIGAVHPLADNVLPLAVSSGFGTQNCQTKIKVKWNTKS